jgi:hypothetical protein
VLSAVFRDKSQVGRHKEHLVLSLDSPRWNELHHAYGAAGDIPALLHKLKKLPEDDGESEPWFPLWSALAHQGDVFPASFAAVPHVIAALEKSPAKAHESYFHFPAWVEICRVKQSVAVPSELQKAYFSSLSKLPQLAATAVAKPTERGLLACTLAATAAAKGEHAIAEAILEMAEDGTAEEFLEWHCNQ